MASWIVHLRVAENLLQIVPGLDPDQFAVGNIGPDSGIPDAKWETFDPPTEITHFHAPAASAHQSDDLGFYQKYLAGWAGPAENMKEYSFLLGYFCHLVVDNLWSDRIGKPTLERYQARFAADSDFIWEVKKDWYGLDFVYVRTHPQSLFWTVFLQCGYPVNYLEVLNPEGVRQRIAYIKDFYRRTDAETEEMVSRERIYLTKKAMDQFVEEATRILSRGLSLLREKPDEADGKYSILEIINK
jgi:hypothetical protein